MYGYKNYTKVKAELKRRQESAETLAELHSEELYELSDELKEIDLELRGTGLRIFEAARQGESLEPIKKRNLELNKRRRDIILSLGYPEDYADVKYTCKLCKDTGVTLDGTCSCARELMLKENIKSSGIGNLIERQSFENFELERFTDPTERAQMEHVVKAAKSFAEKFGSDSKVKNLLLIGTTGTGKTHISTAIAKRVIERGYEVIYDSVHNILNAFNYDQFKAGYSEEPRSEKYLECELLILDDLGTEFSTQFNVACIYNILNTRMNRGLSTVISTNLDAEALSTTYADRIYSRLVGEGTKILNFVGQDKRLYK